MTVHVRHEVWISAHNEPWRFNACFDDLQRAELEAAWYRRLEGYRVELRVRTTRFQSRKDRTYGHGQ